MRLTSTDFRDKFRANARSLVAFLVNMQHAIVAIMTASDPDTDDLIRDGVILFVFFSIFVFLLLLFSFTIISFLFNYIHCLLAVSGARHRIDVKACPPVPTNLIYSALFSIRRDKKGILTLPFVASDGREDLIRFEQALVSPQSSFLWVYFLLYRLNFSF